VSGLQGKNGPPIGSVWQHHTGLTVRVVEHPSKYPDSPLSEVIKAATKPDSPGYKVGHQGSWPLLAVYGWWPADN